MGIVGPSVHDEQFVVLCKCFPVFACADNERDNYPMIQYENAAGWLGMVEYRLNNVVDILNDIQKRAFENKVGNKIRL